MQLSLDAKHTVVIDPWQLHHLAL